MTNDKKILILEDNTLLAMFIEDAVQSAGYKNFFSCQAAECALIEIGMAPPAFAFLDYNLGNDSTSELVARALLDANIPFVFLSGYSKETGIIPDGLGEKGRVSKPFKAEDLLVYLKEHAALSS